MNDLSLDPPELDLRGLKCPMPVLQTRRALRALPPGQRLLVLCTDPLSQIDIPHLLRSEGHRLEHAASGEGVFRFLVVKADPGSAHR